MKRILLIVLLGCVCTSLCFAQTKCRQVGDDGFVWYQLQDGNGHYGAEDENGNVLIPLSRQYSYISWWCGKGKYFMIEKQTGSNTYVGVCDKWGKEIVSPNKYNNEQYMAVFYYPTKDVETGLHGFAISDIKEPGWKHYNLNIFLDSDYKAYSLSNGSKKYISDGTNGSSYSSATNESITQAKGGIAESVWYDHDVYLNGKKGMKIHFKGRISGYKGKNIRLRICHFFYHEDGSKLWGNTSGYTTSAKDQVVALVEDRITPPGNITGLTDWWVFVPYSALHCNKSCTLKIATVMRDETNGDWLGEDAYVTYINYNAASNTPTYNPSVAFTPFYYPIPKFNFDVKFDFTNINSDVPMQSSGVGGYGGDYSGGSEAGSGSANAPRQLTTKTCGVCHGTGKCNNCVNGWVTRMGMGKDGPCPVCPNHNGLCSSCGGRGTWKE